jgi:hypothetical protein
MVEWAGWAASISDAMLFVVAERFRCHISARLRPTIRRPSHSRGDRRLSRMLEESENFALKVCLLPFFVPQFIVMRRVF